MGSEEPGLVVLSLDPGDTLGGRAFPPELVFCVATFNTVGFCASIGATTAPVPLDLPPMASYRCTMSEIDVRRDLLGATSSGGASAGDDGGTVVLSLFEFPMGKMSID